MMSDIDLRKEINTLLNDHGHFILLQRTSRKLRCVCWDEKLKESTIKRYIEVTKDIETPHKECPKCLGAGWVSRIERIKTRRDVVLSNPALSEQIGTLSIGQHTFDAKAFFFQHDIRPQEGDYIFEVGWDGNKPTHLINSYRIQMAIDKREKAGRIEFWVAITKEDNIGTGIQGFGIKKLGPVYNYEILR